MKLVQLGRKQYLDGLRQEIEEHGLRDAIEERLLAIDELCRGMSYPFHREIQEHCSDIYDLLTVFSRQMVRSQDSHPGPKWRR